MAEADVAILLQELGAYARRAEAVPFDGTRIIPIAGPPSVQQKAAGHPRVIALFPDSALTLY